MSNTIIRVENISKQYRLGEVSTGALVHDINRWWHKIRGKENPYLKIGETNDRTTKGNSEYVWALENINFDVKQGEVLGIIGRNGAGKSTLLKILSKVTQPTTGKIKVKGRIASLLEVGTGFHPELSGRDNIFLNGAILGMTRREIQRKFDEIVAFAGIERYIDTPVKRYSSGMYVRLAFAVAAHLEPEILIIDEVLAVGDAEFQKKCLGKMKDVSVNEGRTVLFVSHNMTAVRTLCSKSIWLKNGTVKSEGDTFKIIDEYLYEQTGNVLNNTIDCSQDKNFGSEYMQFLKVAIEADKEKITVADDFSIYFEFENFVNNVSLHLSFLLYTMEDICVFNTGSKPLMSQKGVLGAKCQIPGNLLNDDHYRVRILVVRDGSTGFIDIENIITFQVHDIERTGNWFGKSYGIVRPDLKWEFKQLN